MPPLTNANSTHTEKTVRAQFTIIYPTPGCGFSLNKGQCKHCTTKPLSWNVTTNQGPHLLGCNGQKKYQEDNEIDLESKKKKQLAVTDFFTAQNATAEELFTLTIYTSIASFSQFNTPEWKAFYVIVGFKAPNRKALAGPLLTAWYEKIKKKVQLVADAASYIQIVTDGSSNISKVRVENTSFLVDGILYYQNSIGIGAVKAGLAWTVKNVIKNAKEITKGALYRWTAFLLDTCNTQRRVWKDLIKQLEASHVLSVPCDSHGIQLIFKDLLLPGKDLFQLQITTTLGKFFKDFSNHIVSFFSKSNKQLAYLRDVMVKCNRKIIALITTVPTRQST